MVEYVDPVKTLVDIFEQRHPEKDCKVDFVLDPHKKTDAYGETFWSDNGDKPYIQVDAEMPMTGVIEVLGHELAHVAAGQEAEHGPEWEKAEETLRLQFNITMQEKLGE